MSISSFASRLSILVIVSVPEPSPASRPPSRPVSISSVRMGLPLASRTGSPFSSSFSFFSWSPTSSVMNQLINSLEITISIAISSTVSSLPWLYFSTAWGKVFSSDGMRRFITIGMSEVTTLSAFATARSAFSARFASLPSFAEPRVLVR